MNEPFRRMSPKAESLLLKLFTQLDHSSPLWEIALELLAMREGLKRENKNEGITDDQQNTDDSFGTPG